MQASAMAPTVIAVPDPDLTLQGAAEALGVHYMTAYRYVRLGLLAATKSGGTWHVAQSDVDVFRAGGIAGPSPGGGSGSGSGGGGGRRRAPWSERFEARLLAGDARGAWGVVEAALASGAELEAIYLDVIGPAMSSIGDRWERNEIDVSLEHRASGIAMRLIGRLGPRFVRRGRTRGAVIIGAPAGERHALPVAMVADLTRQQGWDVSDLGADVPDSSFLHAALATPDLAAIGVSVSGDQHLEAARSALAVLRAGTTDVLLVVGGRAVRDEAHGLHLGADAVATDVKSFARLLDAVNLRH
jgi:MerR family transcriptional regulator, light-induced transcriptional regulator